MAKLTNHFENTRKTGTKMNKNNENDYVTFTRNSERFDTK